MTLPKTHPLYGAVEALMPSIAQLITEIEEGRAYRSPKGVFGHIQQQAEGYIRALEAAGYKVVGPEPTEAMCACITHAAGTLSFKASDIREALKEAIEEAPTITGTEKSDE